MRNCNEDTRIKKVEIRTSPISGQGTFANKKIKAGEYITTLSGEFVITKEINKVSMERGWRIEDPLQIDDEVYLALNNESKLINHSCNPNTGMRNKSDLFAVRDIEVNEEITYDYSSTCGINDQMDMSCSCHTPLCRHQIGNILTLPHDVLLNYLEMNALPEFIKRQLQLAGKL